MFRNLVFIAVLALFVAAALAEVKKEVEEQGAKDLKDLDQAQSHGWGWGWPVHGWGWGGHSYVHRVNHYGWGGWGGHGHHHGHHHHGHVVHGWGWPVHGWGWGH